MSSQADTNAAPSGGPGGGAAAANHRALTVADLAGHPTSVLKDEGPGAARVVRCDLPGGPVVLKEWRPAGRLIGWWARRIMRREIRHYRLLQGVAGIPRYLGHDGDAALIIEFVDGAPIHRRLEPARLRAGLDSLQLTLDAVHARRFVHVDLHQKLNVLIDRAGNAWLIDLGQGIDCSRGPLRRLLFPLLARVDQKAVLKFRARYAPDTFEPARRDELVARFGQRRAWWPKLLGRKLRRLVLRES